MKKSIPYFLAVFDSFAAALLIQSLLCFLSIVMSPFSGGPAPYIFIAIMVLSVILLVASFIVNVNLIIDLPTFDRIAVTEILVFLLLLIPFWQMWDKVFDVIF